MGLFGRLRQGLTRTKQQLADRFDDIIRRADTPERRSRAVDVETIEALEELLISADVGVAATGQIVRAVAARSRHGESLRDLVKQEILAIFAGVPAPEIDWGAADGQVPRVALIVGVNGTGKTTTVGKLANLIRTSGGTPLICAADTFRAAAVELLVVWAGGAGVDMVRAQEGADPAAVVFDACKAAVSRRIARLLIDTAGRLHTKHNLMEELKKIHRVIAREVPGAPHETLLVLDATTGLNAFTQAREFHQAVALSGLVVTKLDGTAKGGAVVAIAQGLSLPVRYVGVGEAPEDLQPFNPQEFAAALFF